MRANFERIPSLFLAISKIERVSTHVEDASQARGTPAAGVTYIGEQQCTGTLCP